MVASSGKRQCHKTSERKTIHRRRFTEIHLNSDVSDDTLSSDVMVYIRSSAQQFRATASRVFVLTHITQLRLPNPVFGLSHFSTLVAFVEMPSSRNFFFCFFFLHQLKLLADRKESTTVVARFFFQTRNAQGRKNGSDENETRQTQLDEGA
jgi:hypothetical protein